MREALKMKKMFVIMLLSSSLLLMPLTAQAGPIQRETCWTSPDPVAYSQPSGLNVVGGPVNASVHVTVTYTNKLQYHADYATDWVGEVYAADAVIPAVNDPAAVGVAKVVVENQLKHGKPTVTCSLEVTP